MPEFISQHVPVDLDDFTRGYLAAAEWLLSESDRDLATGFSPEAIEQATADCEAFQAANESDLAEYGNMQEAGVDYWLTRNRHGAGFWDRGLGALGNRLILAAEAYGERDTYVGDDALIYFS